MMRKNIKKHFSSFYKLASRYKNFISNTSNQFNVIFKMVFSEQDLIRRLKMLEMNFQLDDLHIQAKKGYK